MEKTILFAWIGYLSGSLLFAKYFGRLFAKKEIDSLSTDGNPGTANAFRHGGRVCGIVTLICDLLKGFLPVFLYLHTGGTVWDFGLTAVLAAPVVGHAFPLYHRFRGGKGIAVSFGCLLGLLPHTYCVMILAAVFILFAAVVRITPHYHCTWISYLCASFLMPLGASPAETLGFWLISAVVFLRLRLSKEEVGQFKMRLLWRS